MSRGIFCDNESDGSRIDGYYFHVSIRGGTEEHSDNDYCLKCFPEMTPKIFPLDWVQGNAYSTVPGRKWAAERQVIINRCKTKEEENGQ